MANYGLQLRVRDTHTVFSGSYSYDSIFQEAKSVTQARAQWLNNGSLQLPTSMFK